MSQHSEIISKCSKSSIFFSSKKLLFDRWLHFTFLLFAVDEALCHPYLAPLHDINEEPVCPKPFIFDFEQPSFTEENIKELIWRESVNFNPVSWELSDQLVVCSWEGIPWLWCTTLLHKIHQMLWEKKK